MHNKKIITFSGVHGVGKTTILERIASDIHYKPSFVRPPNPFLSPYEGMLFFIAAFSWRDQKAIETKDDVILDRWASIDILVYIKALLELGRINKEQYKSLVDALKHSSSNRIQPIISVLLDDKPANILARIEMHREPSRNHIYERDLEFISSLRNIFYAIFNELKNKSAISIVVINVDGRTPDQIAMEVKKTLIPIIN